MRSPNTTVLTTAITTTTGSGDNINVTDTAGGTSLKWITKPFLAAATLATKVQCSIWAKETSAAANSGVGVNLYPYSADTEGSVFLDHNDTVELTTSFAAQRILTAAATSQAFAIGDRLVIKLFAVAVGTMGAVTGGHIIDYDGPTAGADGDTYIDILEDFRCNERQVGSGSTVWDPGMTDAPLTRCIDVLQEMVARKYISNAATVRQVLDSMTFERNILCPRTAITIPV